MSKKIAIIGAGRIGKAIGKEVGADYYIDKGDAWQKADIYFLCIPSWEVNNIKLPQGIIISLIKGLVDGQSMAEYLKNYNFSILGGPMMAEEEGKIGVMSPYREDIKFKNIKIIKADDPHSVAMAGVLKNIYTLIIGKEKSNNQKGYLVSEAIKEILLIAEQLKLNKDILLGPAGLGDLVATAFSPFSRNRKSATSNIKSEGRESLKSLIKMVNTQKLPLLRSI